MTPQLAEQFEQHRTRLRSIAFRMLGSHNDAEDAVQETWLRLQRTDAGAVDNLAGWLTVVLSRVCLDQLRSRGSRPEDPVEEVPEDPGEGTTPEDLTIEADAVGAALLVVLDTLAPAERLAFVLHDLFGLPFTEIAPIVDRSPAAARQLASRARRRVQGVRPTDERDRQREVVGAFLKAAREGDFGGLLQLLDPEVELRADPLLVQAIKSNAPAGAPLLDAEQLHGADAVARVFAGRAAAAQVALVNGVPAAVWAPGGTVRTVYAIRLGRHDGSLRITGIEVLGRPEELAELTIEL
ncbi:sigma-70 family RNA polymerase sigma factor [Microlunatus sp. Gsoil 973]|uniref:sigma-70 family RNA polymerase sigma factor n=1 Tax=Microlunatus sp. Gsoil 973 TaxID=2672569 RepID=UPI0012B4C176|nr:sigma-70 family RNA polymerase sigma factor [Microlunatus sp. Gsoil 973]QGN33376.1 sigma-70 family RNA polymerase sigma factor [Microlunatus sp. Gsoil 973]